MRTVITSIQRLRSAISPEIRHALDGFGLFFAITLFFV